MSKKDSDEQRDDAQQAEHEDSAAEEAPKPEATDEGLRPWFAIFSPLEREERIELVERIETGGSGGIDYVVLMLLSAFLAALGLLQNSTAVVIGAMLVAPLMGPLLAAGLAIVQGNAHLMRKGMAAVGLGLVLGFLASSLVGLLNPGFEPSLEVEARGTPDLLDLAVAFISGMVAAYANSRPKVASSLAGVAIAAALVPPLAVVGIGLTNDRLFIAANSTILLLTNVVAIILGAALVFRMLGVQHALKGKGVPAWVRVTTLVLVGLVGILAAPLTMQVALDRSTGPDRPLTHPVAQRVREAVKKYIEAQDGVELVTIARVSVEPESGITVMLAAADRLPAGLKAELRRIVVESRGRETPVRVLAFVEAPGGG